MADDVKRSPGTSGRWGCLVGTWLLSVAANALLIVPAGILPRMMDTFGTGPALTVWVVSGAFAAWALSNFGVGLAIDRTSDFAVATAATLLITVAGVWGWQAGLNGHFWSLMGSRALAGIAIGAVWTTGANLVGRAFSHGTQGTALGVFTTSAPAGLAIGQLLGPLIAARWGWPANFLGFGVATLCGFALFLGGYRRTDFAEVERSVPGLTDLVDVVRQPAVAYGSALGFLAYSLFLFFNSWMPTYLAQEFTLSLTSSSLFLALFPAVGIVSRAGGGVISDRFLDGRRRPVIRLSFLSTAPLVVGIAVTAEVGLLVALLVAAGFTVQLSIGIFYSYVREVVETARTGTALSILVTACITGAFLTPAFTGWLIDRTGSYSSAFTFAGILAVAGVILSWRAPES